MDRTLFNIFDHLLSKNTHILIRIIKCQCVQWFTLSVNVIKLFYIRIIKTKLIQVSNFRQKLFTVNSSLFNWQYSKVCKETQVLLVLKIDNCKFNYFWRINNIFKILNCTKIMSFNFSQWLESSKMFKITAWWYLKRLQLWKIEFKFKFII